MPTTYGVAYSNHYGVPHHYGTSAPHRDTGPPRLTQEEVNHIHDYRRAVAYPPNAHGEPVYVPPSLTTWPRPCQCAEAETVPRVVSESSHLLVDGVTVQVTSLTVGRRGRPKAFCDNCQLYAWKLAKETLGLTIIDGTTGDLYESAQTVS
jgi:hypothetical protein